MKPTTGIRRKLAFAFALITLVIGGFAIHAAYTQYDMANKAALIEATNVANVIAYTGVEDVISRPEFLQTYVSGLRDLYDRDIVIVDVQKRCVADANKSEVGEIYTYDRDSEVSLTISDGQNRIFVEKNDLHPAGAEQIVVPLRRSQEKRDSPIVGAVILEYTGIHQNLLSAVRVDMYENLILGFACILFAVFVGFRTISRVAKPLEDLERGVRAIAAGNYDFRVKIGAKDEVGALGEAFNKTAAQLKENYARLTAYQSELEERVAEAGVTNVRLEKEVLERAKSEKYLRESEERYRQLVELSPEAICIETEGKVVFANGACAKLLGAATSREIVGRPAADFIHPHSLEVVEQRRREVRETKLPTPQLEAKLIRLDGSVVDVEGVAGPFLYQGKLATQLVIRDITERKRVEERLAYLAQYDSLTGLPNRALFRDRLEHAIAKTRRKGNKLALMFLDLDRFKEINDSLGHTVGDEVLQVVGRLFKDSLRDVDTIARLGGDEFTIILDDLNDVEQASGIAERIRETLAAPMVINGQEIFVTASIGIAIFPINGRDIEELIQAADAAMYKAKEEGRNTYAFFNPEMNREAAEYFRAVGLMRHALERNEFVLHYQPKVALETRRIVGVEALIRWQSPELGLVPPMKFIPRMEKTGLIVEVGAWALRQAVADCGRWLEQGLPASRVAVNVSPIQLRKKDFLARVEAAIRHGPTPPGLDLEITESLIMDDIEGNICKLKEVRGLGVGIAIDDFGTGYSSLAYLAKLPVQTLKIDRSFIITMLKDPDVMTLVQAIISMAHSLRLKVVAEGVDEEEQAKMLQLLHCEEMQGYLFSKPLPFDEMTALFKQDSNVR